MPVSTPLNNPLLISLTNILATSGLRLPQGRRVRNLFPDASNPILMFWPDNELLPTLSQSRRPLPADFAHSAGKKDRDVAGESGTKRRKWQVDEPPTSDFEHRQCGETDGEAAFGLDVWGLQ
ncbi:hypothetical protein FRC01_001494, partial [Tulasnella sp. 417]